MDSQYWKGRWQRGELGWHADEVNRSLESRWSDLDLPHDATVLVPLCGKSLDVGWLLSRGHRVVGVEVSELACEELISVVGAEVSRGEAGPFKVLESGPLKLLCGDVFQLEASHVGPAQAWYDRAALVALNPDQRPRYRAALESVLSPGARGLVLGLSYPDHEKDGPPFTVPEREVLDQWGSGFDVQVLEREDVLDHDPKFRRWGLSELTQTTYLLRRR